jgi:hypothetical protein
MYLGILRETCDRVNERLRRLKERGQPVPDFPFDYDQIAAKVRGLLQVGGGGEGRVFAHAVVQKAKHPLAEIIDRQYLAWEAKEEALSRESARRAAEQLVQAFRAYDVKRVVANSPPALQAEIDKQLVAIAVCTPDEDPGVLAEQVSRALASAVPALILAVLKAHRLTLEERLLTQRTARVTARLAAEHNAAYQSEVAAQLTLAREELGFLEDERQAPFASELEQLHAEAAQLNQDRFYTRFEDIRRRIGAERQRSAMISLVQTVLQRHGYQEMDVMETVTPSDIRKRRARTLYFRDGEDGDRYVELAFADRDAFSMEVVRADDSGDSSDVARDHDAQVRLCDVLAQVRENAGEAFALTALREDPVGVPVVTRRELQQHLSRSNGAGKRSFER